MINGPPVECGMMNVQTKNGKIVGETGKWIVDSQKLSAAAKSKQIALSESIAFQNALNFVGANVYKWENADEENMLKASSNSDLATYMPKGEKVYYSQPTDENLSDLKLAYKFDIYAEEPLSRQYVFVDAQSGEILGTEQLIHETNAPGTAVTGYSGTQTKQRLLKRGAVLILGNIEEASDQIEISQLFFAKCFHHFNPSVFIVQTGNVVEVFSTRVKEFLFSFNRNFF